jgi:flotillin
MFDFLTGPVPGIILLVLVVGVIVLIYARTVYKNAGPDEALIITGKRPKKERGADGTTTERSGTRIVHAQGVFITPFFQKAHKISLRSRAIDISAAAQDQNGITLTVDAVAIVKVGDSESSIRAAAQRFLGQDKNIDSFAQEVLSGSLRASIGSTNVMTIIQKRDELGTTVLNTARESLASQGLDVDSFEIKGITDENDYINDIGRAEQAKVRKQAEIAEHVANRESREAAVTAEQAIAEAENALALKKAALQLDTDRAAAEAAAAKPIAEAKAQQSIISEQEQAAKRRAELRKAELESEVNAKADADAYAIRVNAEAQAIAARTAAEADRDARKASAEAVTAEGVAQADAILARGKAEAESTKLSAQATAENSDQLLALRLIELLPALAKEIAAPMSNIDTLTVVSTDGASELSKNVVGGITQLDAMLESSLGVSIKGLLGNMAGGLAAGKAVASSSGPSFVTGDLAGAAAAVATAVSPAVGSALIVDESRNTGSEDLLPVE